MSHIATIFTCACRHNAPVATLATVHATPLNLRQLPLSVKLACEITRRAHVDKALLAIRATPCLLLWVPSGPDPFITIERSPVVRRASAAAVNTFNLATILLRLLRPRLGEATLLASESI